MTEWQNSLQKLFSIDGHIHNLHMNCSTSSSNVVTSKREDLTVQNLNNHRTNNPK